MSKKDDLPKSEDQAPKPLTLLERLKDERAELADRLGKVTSFICSIDFTGVDREERERLQGQEIAMGHYLGILDARIAYHEAQGK